MSKNKLPVIIGAICAALIIGLMGFGSGFIDSTAAEARPVLQNETALSPRTITVIGEGRIEIEPDIAQINIGIETIGPDVKVTSSEAATSMEALLTAIEGQGIDSNDIQTSYYNIWVDRPYGADGLPGSDAIYHVNNSVIVTVRDLDQVGITLGAAIEAGANNINGVTFSIANPDQLKSEARRQATDDALAKAQELATLHQVSIGQVVSISEVIGSSPFLSGGNLALAEGVGGGGIGPISPGQVEIVSQLQVTYVIE